MRVFAFVHLQKAEFPVKILCAVCEVSASGYYDWAVRLAAGPSPAEVAETELVERIRLVHAESRGRYGEPRVTEQLARDGMAVNHKRVERLMAREGLQGRCGRRKVRTTVADPTKVPAPIWSDASSTATSSTSSGSVTPPTSQPMRAGCSSPPSSTPARAACSAGRSPIISAPSCASTPCPPPSAPAAEHARSPGSSSTPTTAPSTPPTRSGPPAAGFGITQSMGTVGDSYDNAMAESFFASFKREVVDGEHFATRAEARAEIFAWCVWYNSTRLHTSIGNRPPIEYEAPHQPATRSMNRVRSTGGCS